MTRKAFFQKYILRFSASLALAALIVYTLYHAFGNSSGSLSRDYVRLETEVRLLSGEAYLFRDEQVLTVSSPAVVNNLAESGKKVGKGVEIVEVWNGYLPDEIASVQKELDRLNRTIAILENSLSVGNMTLSKAEQSLSDAMRDYLAIRQAVASGIYDGLRDLGDDMLTLLNRYDAFLGTDATLSATLQSMKRERATLLRGGSTVLSNIGPSGYFYDYACVDGYESIFTLSALESLTAASFSDLIASEPQSTTGYAVGKLVHSNRWYLAIGLEAGALELFDEENSYSVSFPESADKTLTMTCTKLLPGTDGSVIAVFATDEVPSDLTYQRMQKVEIEVGSYTGYNIPETAIHIVDGVEGVYIFDESAVYFRRIEVLYRGDGYCIAAEQGDRGNDYLALYDILVIAGDDLYDGRVFR